MKYNKLIYYVFGLILLTINTNNFRISQQKKHDFISSNLLDIGTPAPYFESNNIDGELVKSSDFRGKIILLDWWYVGCKPCIKSMNDIQKIQEKLGEDSFTIIGMNPISKPRAIKHFKKKFGYKHEVVIPDERVKNAYNIRAYPTLYLIGKNGRIIFAKAGYSSDFAKELKQAIIDEIRNHPEIK